jgi:Transposase IS116/IS110/IS902 family
VVAQKQLIAELKLLEEHLTQLEAEIIQIVEQSREGKILTSLPGIGSMAAATLIATIGTIANFERAAQLKSYCGWAPKVAQSGSTLDWARLSPRGVRQTKHTMYLVVWRAIQWDSEWKEIYEHLLPRKCRTDERTHRLIGREKVIGRLAGQMTSVIYALLKQDHELLARTEAGKVPPSPMPYNREVHHQHRMGSYRPSREQEEKSG